MKENSLQDEIGDNRLNGMSTMLTMQIQTKRKNKRERVQKGWRGSTLFNEMKSLNVQERQRRNIKETYNKTKLPLLVCKITKIYIINSPHKLTMHQQEEFAS